ncbi:hypothetical protein [Nannocystis exedens]|nr:hypothetical protein [Nannocystis exedens]
MPLFNGLLRRQAGLDAKPPRAAKRSAKRGKRAGRQEVAVGTCP